MSEYLIPEYYKRLTMFAAGFVAATTLSSVLAPDLEVDFSDEANAAAKVGRLTTSDLCAEQQKVSEKMAVYFDQKAKGDSRNPVFVISKEECEGLVAAKKLASAVRP